MTKKKTIKALMSIGYPRNTARKIIESKKSSQSNGATFLGGIVVAQFASMGLPIHLLRGAV